MKKNTIIKDSLILFAITLIAALLLGLVYDITKKPIEEAELKAKNEAYKKVYSALAETSEQADLTTKLESSAEFLAENPEYEGITIDEALLALDESGTPIGYVMTVTNMNGYGGAIKFAMGYSADGVLTGIQFLTLAETPGLGMKAKDASFSDMFTDVEVGQFALAKAGIAGDVELQPITSATITSAAVIRGVNAGLAFSADLLTNGIGGISK